MPIHGDLSTATIFIVGFSGADRFDFLSDEDPWLVRYPTLRPSAPRPGTGSEDWRPGVPRHSRIASARRKD